MLDRMPPSVNLSPGELQRFERETAAALRKQRLLEVREAEKAAARAKREEFRQTQEKEERQQQALKRQAFLAEKQRELSSLKALHEAAVVAEGEAERTAAELRLIQDLQAARAPELERARRRLEEQRSRVALAEVRNTQDAQKKAQEFKEERRNLVKDVENQRAVETAYRARTLAEKRAAEAAKELLARETVKHAVVPRRDGRGEIDWSKTTYHVKNESEVVIEAQRDRDLSPAPAVSPEQIRRAEIRGSVAMARQSAQIRDDSTEVRLKRLQAEALRAKAKKGAPTGPRPAAPAVPWEALEKAIAGEKEEERPVASPPERWVKSSKPPAAHSHGHGLLALDKKVSARSKSPVPRQHLKLRSSSALREQSAPAEYDDVANKVARSVSQSAWKQARKAMHSSDAKNAFKASDDSRLSDSSSSFSPESLVYGSPWRPKPGTSDEQGLSDESLVYGSPLGVARKDRSSSDRDVPVTPLSDTGAQGLEGTSSSAIKAESTEGSEGVDVVHSSAMKAQSAGSRLASYDTSAEGLDVAHSDTASILAGQVMSGGEVDFEDSDSLERSSSPTTRIDAAGTALTAAEGVDISFSDAVPLDASPIKAGESGVARDGDVRQLSSKTAQVAGTCSERTNVRGSTSAQDECVTSKNAWGINPWGSDSGGVSSIHNAERTSGAASSSSHDVRNTSGMKVNTSQHSFRNDSGAASALSTYDQGKKSEPGLGMNASQPFVASRSNPAPDQTPDAATGAVLPNPSTLGEDELRAQLDTICRNLCLGSS